MKLRKFAAMAMATLMVGASLTACGKSEEKTVSDDTKITVISREDGSGTRSAFVELMGIMENEVDNTVATAEIMSSTSGAMSSVENNSAAIGYISLGSLSDKVKAVKVDGVEATAENVKNGSYKVARPFNIAYKDELSEVAQDFVDYILSKEGQAVVEKNGYISLDGGKSYSGSGMSGKVTLAGSTSVSPLMEKLTEEYKKINPDVEFEIQQSGSSAGMTSAIEGVCDIGMASREIKDSEKSQGLTGVQIAMDGIAVIVNKSNKTENLTSEQIKDIYTGKITTWGDVK